MVSAIFHNSIHASIIISVSVFLLGFFIYDKWKVKNSYAYSNDSIKYKPALKHLPQDFQKSLNLPKKSQLSLYQLIENDGHFDLPEIESLQHKSKTPIIDCSKRTWNLLLTYRQSTIIN